MRLAFQVHGKPQTRGSKRTFPIRRNGQIVGTRTVDDNPNSGEWMQAVALVARKAMEREGIAEPLQGPLRMRLCFYLLRPQGDYKTNGDVRPKARAYPVTRPDALKLTRAVEDALTGVLYRDDAQIVSEEIDKRYGESMGVWVEVETMPETVAAIESA